MFNDFFFLESFASTAFLFSEGQSKPLKLRRPLDPSAGAVKCWQKENEILTSSFDTYAQDISKVSQLFHGVSLVSE